MAKITTFKPEQNQHLRYLGISSSLREYRLCFLLGQQLGLDFRRVHPLSALSKDKNRTLTFNVYAAEAFDPESPYPMALFCIKSGAESYLSGLGQVDFLLRLKPDTGEETVQHYLQTIRNLDGVVLVAEIPAGKVKDAGKLIVEEDLLPETPLRQNRFGNKHQ